MDGSHLIQQKLNQMLYRGDQRDPGAENFVDALNQGNLSHYLTEFLSWSQESKNNQM